MQTNELIFNKEDSEVASDNNENFHNNSNNNTSFPKETKFRKKDTLSTRSKVSKYKKNTMTMSEDVNSISGFDEVNDRHTKYYFQKIKMNNKEKYIKALCQEKTESFFKYFFYIFSNIVNIINVVIYICQSYSERNNENENDSYVKVLNVLDLCCAVYFLVEFLMIILVKKDIKHLFSWEGLIDFFSIIPSMIVYFLSKSNLRTILRMCKVFRVLRIYKSIHTLQYDNSNESGILNVNHIKLQFLSIVIIFFSLFFIASGLVFGLQEIWPSSFNDKDMTFAECVYFIIVTATTVGHGDIYPTNTISRMFIIILIVSFISMVSYQLTKLIQLFQLWGNYAKYTVTNHVILLADSTIDIAEVLREIKNENHRQAVIILSTDIESLPSSEFPYNKVNLIHTKSIDLDILERANAKFASYIIIFASVNFNNCEQSEKVNEFIVLKINQYYGNIPIYVQTLYTDNSFLNNISLKKDEIFRFLQKESSNEVSISKIVSIFRIKSLITAKSMFIPGFANFAQNLILNNNEIPTDFYSYDITMQAYFLGSENTIQVKELPRYFVNQEFYEAMRTLYSKSIRDYIIKVSVHDMKDVNRPVLLIGIIESNIGRKKISKKNRVIMFPKNYKIPRKAMGVFISFNGDNYLDNILKTFQNKIEKTETTETDDEKSEQAIFNNEITRRQGFSEDPDLINIDKPKFGHRASFEKKSNKNLIDSIFTDIKSKAEINKNNDSFVLENENIVYPNIIAELNAIVSRIPRKNSFEEEVTKTPENEEDEMIPKAQSNAVIKYSKDKTNNQNLKSISKENTPIKNNPRNVLKSSKTIASSFFINRNNMLKDITRKKNTNIHKKPFDFMNNNNTNDIEDHTDELKKQEEQERQEKIKRREFFIWKKNQIITGKDELKDKSTKNNLIFLESLDIEDLDKFYKDLQEQTRHRYRSDTVVNTDYTTDNRVFDCAKTNISELFANHILFVGYQDGIGTLLRRLQLHFPYKDMCIMTNYSFDDDLMIKYLKMFKHLYHLRGELSNPTHLINAGIAKASYVVFLVDKIDERTNEDMSKILGFRAVDYFFQTNMLLELWDHSNNYLLGYNPVSKSHSVMKNEFCHPLYIGGKLLYLNHLNRIICKAQKDQNQVDSWIELLSLGYKTSSNNYVNKGGNVIVAHEKCGFPVMLTVDLPEKYIGKEYFNVFTDLICQKEPMMILGIYIENPLEYNQLRSEGRISRFTRMQTNQLKIVTSHKKVLMNMGALSENEQNYLSYLKTLKDISYNDKILLDSIDLRHPFFPMFITNPPPWFILSEDTKILVLFFHEPNTENGLTKFQKQICRVVRKKKKEYFGTGINQRNKVLLNQRQDNFYLTLNIFKEKIQQKYTEAFKDIERDATVKKTLVFNKKKSKKSLNEPIN